MAERIIGMHSIEEYIRRGGSGRLLFSKTNQRVDRIISVARERGIPCRRVSNSVLNAESEGREHRGVVLLPSKESKREAVPFDIAIQRLGRSQDSLVVILDGVSDPGNLGGILRSADLFGVDLVVVPQRGNAPVSATVRTRSAGASEHIQLVVVSNLPRAMDRLKDAGFWIYGADLHGEPSWRVQFARKCAIVMGGEGRGLRRLVSERCDTHVTIPTGGHIDSLNVSVAAGVLLYEIRRGWHSDTARAIGT